MERLFSNIQQASIPVGCVPPAFVVSVGKWVGYPRGVYATPPQISYPLDPLSPRYPAPLDTLPLEGTWYQGYPTTNTLPSIPYPLDILPPITYFTDTLPQDTLPQDTLPPQIPYPPDTHPLERTWDQR